MLGLKLNHVSKRGHSSLCCMNPCWIGDKSMYIQCGAIIMQSIFSKIITKTPHSSPVRVYFVGSNLHSYSAPVTIVMCTISYCIGLRYDGIWLYRLELQSSSGHKVGKSFICCEAIYHLNWFWLEYKLRNHDKNVYMQLWIHCCDF